MKGIEQWTCEVEARDFFGLDRSLPMKLAPSRNSRVEGVRRWLGYRLYAVVHWLLRGHA